MNFLRSALQIKNGEEKKILPFFLSFFFLIGSFLFGRTARDTFFLSRFDPAYLPHMMILTAIVMGITIALTSKFLSKIPIVPQIIFTFLFTSISFIIIQLLLSDWVYPVLYIWSEVIFTLMTIQFWILTGSSFKAREAKRLFSLIGSGAAIANSIIGFSMSSIINSFGTDILLPATSAFIGFATITSFISRKYVQIDNRGSGKAIVMKNSTESKSKKLIPSKYLKIMALTTICAALITALVDFQMKMIVSSNLDEEAMASLFGTMYGAIGIISVLIQFFFTGRFLSRFGVLWGVMMLPLALLVGSVSILILPVIFSAILAKASENIFRFTIFDTTKQLLWLPVPIDHKTQAKPFIDGTLKNAAGGIAGLLIIGISFLLSFDTYDNIRWLSLPSLGMLILWIIFNFKLKKGYVSELTKAIEKRRIDFEELDIDINDPTIVNTIKKTLSQGDDNQKLFALNTMKGLSLTSWKKDLINLFENGSNEIKGKLLIMTSKHPNVISNKMIYPFINDSDELLASRAIISFGIRKNQDVVETLTEFINHQNQIIRAASCASLILMKKNNDIARDTINSMLFDSNEKTKLAALNSVGHISDILSSEGLGKLLNDKSPDVRIHAAKLAEKRNDNNLIIPLIKNLNNINTLPAARRSLRSFDKNIVSKNLIEIIINKSKSGNQLIGPIRAISDYRKNVDPEKIFDSNHSYNLEVTKEVSDTLIKLAKKLPLNKNTIEKSEKLLISLANKCKLEIDLIKKFEKNNETFLINDQLINSLNKKRSIILKLALLSYPDSPIETYLKAINSKESNSQSNVLEILENLLSKEIRDHLIPIFDPTQIKNFEDVNKSDEIKNWLNSDNSWNVALGLHYLMHKKLPLNKINWSKMSTDFKIKEQCSIDWRKKESLLKNVSDFPSEKFILDDLSMYSTLEKTIFMKGVDLFKDISGQEVSNIAQIAKEREFSANERIMNHGDNGDSMFIIISGSVKVHIDNKELTTLSKGDCIGEMALLDQEPRSASVTTKEETTLLEIYGEDFYDLMASRMDIMQGIVKVLSRRIRKNNQ